MVVVVVAAAGVGGGRGGSGGLGVSPHGCLRGEEARVDVGLFLEAQMCPWAGAGLPGCPLSNKGPSAGTSGPLAAPTSPASLGRTLDGVLIKGTAESHVPVNLPLSLEC